ncbi:MAG: hypothetical protein Kow0090_09070 [Myxococcota bacterium]
MNEVKKMTPRETVAEKFGSKESLAKKLSDRIGRPEGVTEADFVRRLKRQKNSKLLRLYRIAEVVEKEFGSKEKLVEAILQTHGHTNDGDFKKKLMTYSISRLYDLKRKKPRG